MQRDRKMHPRWWLWPREARAAHGAHHPQIPPDDLKASRIAEGRLVEKTCDSGADLTLEGPAALRVEPRLASWRDRLGDATGVTPVLAGSGSTWFVDGAFPGEGRVVTRTTPAREARRGRSESE